MWPGVGDQSLGCHQEFVLFPIIMCIFYNKSMYKGPGPGQEAEGRPGVGGLGGGAPRQGCVYMYIGNICGNISGIYRAYITHINELY